MEETLELLVANGYSVSLIGSQPIHGVNAGKPVFWLKVSRPAHEIVPLVNVTGTGHTIEEARKDALAKITNLEVCFAKGA